MKYIKVLGYCFGGISDYRISEHTATLSIVLINFDEDVLRAFIIYLHETWHWLFLKLKSLIGHTGGYDEYEYPMVLRFVDFLCGFVHYIPILG